MSSSWHWGDRAHWVLFISINLLFGSEKSHFLVGLWPHPKHWSLDAQTFWIVWGIEALKGKGGTLGWQQLSLASPIQTGIELREKQDNSFLFWGQERIAQEVCYPSTFWRNPPEEKLASQAFLSHMLPYFLPHSAPGSVTDLGACRVGSGTSSSEMT